MSQSAQQVFLEDIVRAALGEEKSGVVDIGNVQNPIALSGRSRELEIDDAVGDGLTVDERVHLSFTLKGLGKRELSPVGYRGSGCDGRATT